jgi:hypothetical protein
MIKPGEKIILTDTPMEGYRTAEWQVNVKHNHHTLKISGGYGNEVTLYNQEIDKLYEVLSEIRDLGYTPEN